MEKSLNIDVEVDGWKKWNPEEVILVDIRSQVAYDHGFIPGFVQMDLDLIKGAIKEGESSSLAKEWKRKKVILCCKSGIISRDLAMELRKLDIEAYNLLGGYHQWLLDSFEKDNMALDEEKKAAKKLFKKLVSQFAKAVAKYELIKEKDKIAICISGGKDSMLMAKLFQELKRHNKFDFSLEFLVMDPGYHPDNRKIIETNAKNLEIPISIFESDIFDAVFHVEKSPCYLCARMRRGFLYNRAKELGCNKIALGHHYDDVIETIFMGMLYGGQVQTMMPKLHSTNFEGMELIRPLYLIREDDIKLWRDLNHLHFLQCACRFTETCSTCSADGSNASKRQEVKQLIAQLKKSNPYVEANIFKSVENVNLDRVIAYKYKEQEISNIVKNSQNGEN